MVSCFQLDSTQRKPTYPFPPQPEHCLYFYPRDKVTIHNYSNESVQKVPLSILIGPQLSRYDLTIGYNMRVIMVGFQPGGMHRLLRIPMYEIVNAPTDPTLILGREIEDVAEQLSDASDSEKMVEIVQLYLLKKAEGLKRMLPIEEVLIRMLNDQNLMNVDQLAKQACVSTRQLERQLIERMGMPPKLFSRMVRFSKASIMRERKPDISWVKIAHACDYADQMHMIRDFKDLAGVTPRILQTDLERSDLRLQALTFV
jgi:AraC-like DNA-binding protein